VAWYGLLFTDGEWRLVGPYADRADCSSVIEWLDTQGYDTETCTMMSTDPDAILVQVGERPRE